MSDVSGKVKEYISTVQNALDRKPTTIKSDNVGEYVNDEIEEYLRENGMEHQHPRERNYRC